MRIVRCFSVAAITLGAATAYGEGFPPDNDAGGEPLAFGPEADASYEATLVRLGAAGYSSLALLPGRVMPDGGIKIAEGVDEVMADGEVPADGVYRLSAIDTEGSEVVLRIDARTGDVMEVFYVHYMDR